MIYRFKNITNSSSDPKNITISDIPGLQAVTIRPGQTVDLERLATRNQILDSGHVKIHLLEGRASLDLGGTEFTPDERIFVDGYISGGKLEAELISSDSEPILVLNTSSGLDRFGRQRISTPHLVFESHLTFSDLPNLWGDILSGSATSTYLANEAAVELKTSTSNGDVAIRQTHQYFNYHPGLSYQILMTGLLGEGKTGVTQRIGYFDDADGLFFQQTDGELSVVIRSSTSGAPLETTIAQASWSIDKLDGTGSSGIAIDPTKTQIFVIDLSWLGVGGVRFGIVAGQQIIYIHEEILSNTITSAYMKTAVLPLRYEIRNTATTQSETSLKAICNSILKEGEGELVQTSRSVNTGSNTKTVGTSSFESLLALRLQPGFEHARFEVDTFSLHFSSTSDVLVEVVKNPTLVGANWSAELGTIVESDSSATSITGGEVLYSEYVKGPQHRSPTDALSGAKEVITTNVNGVRDIVAIRAIALSGNDNIAVAINFSEIF